MKSKFEPNFNLIHPQPGKKQMYECKYKCYHKIQNRIPTDETAKCLCGQLYKLVFFISFLYISEIRKDEFVAERSESVSILQLLIFEID